MLPDNACPECKELGMCVLRTYKGYITRGAGRGEAVSYRAAITATRGRVAHCLALGMTNKEIARELNMSEGGIRYHVGNILAELKVPNRTQAALRMRDEWSL